MRRASPRTLIIVLAAQVLYACGGGGSAPSSQPPPPPPPPPPPTANTGVGGSVGDGPVTAAQVSVLSGTTVLATAVSDQRARYAVALDADDADFPLVVSARGGTDMVSGSAPLFELRSVVMGTGLDQVVNVNPFTTLIVHGAEASPAGLGAATVSDLTAAVYASVGFGLDTQRLADPLSTPITSANAAHIVKASEMLGEAARRTQAALAVLTPNLTVDGVFAAVAADLADGALDGDGVDGSDLRITATWKVAAGQVVLEALRDRLQVAGIEAGPAMDAAIATITEDANALTTAQVAANAAILAQLQAALSAVAVLEQNDALVALSQAVAALTPGMSGADIDPLIPAGAGALFEAMLALMPAADGDTLTRMANGGDDTPNQPPTISGTPASSVLQDSPYSFVPQANDPDGDDLLFAIDNPPPWATFDPLTGALSGTPGNAGVGTTSGIVISVSDGQDGAQLPPFSVTVVDVNDPPQIGGTPDTSVLQDNDYAFVPQASDADGDSLTFSVQNAPAWSVFDVQTGALTGTPGNADVGTDAGIVIGVSDGQAGTELPPFSITVVNVNDPPTISGSPALSVLRDSPYDFTPGANDPDGDLLAFSVQNAPAWASFDPATGRLFGTPGALDVGVNLNVTIAVSDGELSSSLPPYDLTVLDSNAGTATINWTAPTLNADQTPLADLAGFRIYYSTTPGSFVTFDELPDPSATSYLLEDLAPATWHFVVSAYDTAGNESAFSDSATKTVN